MKFLTLLFVLVCVVGCGSFFQSRLQEKDTKVIQAEIVLEQAVTIEEKLAAEKKLNDAKRQLELATQLALQEQQNKQAMTLAVIGLVAGGLKLASKGV